MTPSKYVLAIFLLLALLGLVFAAKDLSKDTDGDGLKDHVDDYDDDNDNIPDIHDEDDDGDYCSRPCNTLFRAIVDVVD